MAASASLAVHRPNHRPDVDAVLPAEFEIALIVRGHGHDRAGAVAHQHEVADPDGNRFAAEGIDGAQAGIEAFLLDIARALLRARVDHLLRRACASGPSFVATISCSGARIRQVAP